MRRRRSAVREATFTGATGSRTVARRAVRSVEKKIVKFEWRRTFGKVKNMKEKSEL